MGTQGTGRRDAHRHSARLALGVLALACLVLGFSVAPALGSTHAVVTGEYGKEGPASTGLGNGCRLAYQSSTQHLYLFSEEKIFGLSVSPGSATPLGGAFPVNTGINSGCGDPDLEVNQANGNIFAVPSNQNIYGWSGAGSALGSPWPVSAGGETCGVTVTSTGEVWGGNYGSHAVTKFSASGAAEGSINVGFSFCKLAVDRSNDDLYVAPYNTEDPLVKFTAASGYTEKINFPAAGDGDPGLAINGAEFKIYVGNGSENVKAYSTQTGELVETIELGEPGGRGIAVDENTDTLFVTTNGEHPMIKEYLGITTPKATTGPPTANSEVSGTADPNGVGPITECYFEYGTTTSYGSKQDCTEPVPISSTETVHATLPALIGEQVYHYRLVLGTGVQFVIGRGGDGTITPHNVKGLTTTDATEITQQSATLNASFEGTNEDTHYYFEWGQTTNYGNVTAAPPGADAGTTTGLTTVKAGISGLTPGVVYHYRVVGENQIGVSKANDRTFKTFEPPSVESATSSNLTPTSAEIDARINPNGFETEYFVEYGLTPAYGSVAYPVPPDPLPAVSGGQEVKIPLANLEGVTYHFRVIAENKWGQVSTGDQTFEFFPPACPNEHVRQETFATYLPDCRAYELVSPEDGNGTIVFGGGGPVAPYADNVYAYGAALGEFPGTGDPVNSIYVDTYAATRTNDGWKTKFIGIPGNKALQASTPLANLTMERLLSFSYDYAVPGGSSAPYVYDASDHQLGRWPEDIDSIPGGNEFTGEFFERRGTLQPSPDFSHLAFSSNTVQFTEDGLTSPPGSAYDYDTASGTTALISIAPGGGPIQAEPGDANDPAGFINFPARYETPVQMYPSVSTDGSHILMSTNATPYDQFNNPHPDVHLYMRVNDQVTYDVSKGHVVQYLGMTPEGDHVFFFSREQLLPEDQDNSVDLYRWNEATDSLTLVSAGNNGAGNTDSCTATWTAKCNVLPVIGAAITDNSIAANGDVYFYSPEQLDGTKGSFGQQNLYDFREGAPHFVASLTPNELCGENGCANGPVGQIQVSPDDQHAAFLSASRVTSYDNHGHAEMYTVDPPTGNILCVSCRPDGKPPVSDVSASEHGLFMADDGRVFFYTADALVPQDTNELHDVYEYVGGRARLITLGTGAHDKQVTVDPYSESVRSAAFLGVSADGQNAYFSTFDTLVGQDRNGNFLKIYDARSGGGFPYVPPKGLCEAADECHGAGSAAPAPADVGSSARLGSGGNVHPAAKHKHQAKKKKHSKKNHARKRRHHG